MTDLGNPTHAADGFERGVLRLSEASRKTASRLATVTAPESRRGVRRGTASRRVARLDPGSGADSPESRPLFLWELCAKKPRTSAGISATSAGRNLYEYGVEPL